MSTKFLKPKSILFFITIWIIIFGATEVTLKIAGFGSQKTSIANPRFNVFQADPDLTWSLKENWSGFEVNEAPVSTNSIGFRGDEPFSNHDFRVLFLGDSVTYGHYLSNEETIPFHLQKTLSFKKKSSVEVLNAGVPGYSTFQEEILFRIRGAKLNSKLVILGFFLNDVTERYSTVAAYGGSQFFLNVDTSISLSPIKKIWQKTAIREALVKVLKISAKRGENYRAEKLWKTPDASHIRLAWDVVFQELDLLAENVKQQGSNFIVVIFPYRVQLENYNQLNIPQIVLIEHLIRKRIPFLDLLPHLAQSKIDPKLLYWDANHFNAFGAFIASKHISNFLLKREFL